MTNYENLISNTQLKKILVSEYATANEFNFLKKLKKDYEIVKASISFYILSDKSSKRFVHKIQERIIDEGLTINKLPISDASLKVLITSNIANSTNNLRFTIYNINKEQIASNNYLISNNNSENSKKLSIKQFSKRLEEDNIFNIIGISVK